jgi:hypothetical protein
MESDQANLDLEEKQWSGEVFAIRCLQSLPIYLCPIDLKAWCRSALEEHCHQELLLDINHVCRANFEKGAQLVFDLVNRLPIFGMAWRLNHLVKQLNKSGRIDPEDQDLWRKD